MMLSIVTHGVAAAAALIWWDGTAGEVTDGFRHTDRAAMTADSVSWFIDMACLLGSPPSSGRVWFGRVAR